MSSINSFIREIVSARGGPSNPTLYEFDVAPSASGNLKTHLRSFGFEWDKELRFLNYINNEIQIPGVTFQNSEIRQYRKGLSIKMASSKIFNEMDMTFICDVTSMPYRFFRGWIDYIGDLSENSPTLYNANSSFAASSSALHYYHDYVCNFTIKKIEKKPGQTNPLNVTLVNAWPFTVASVPMSSASQNGLVKLTVSMYYEYSRAYYSPNSNSPGSTRTEVTTTSTAANEEQRALAAAARNQPNFLGNTQAELDALRKGAYDKSTKGRTFKSEAAREIADQYRQL